MSEPEYFKSLEAGKRYMEAKAKELRRFAEKIITIARKGYDFNTIRHIKRLLPYDNKMVEKVINT